MSKALGWIIALVVLLGIPTAFFGLGWITQPLLWLLRTPVLLLAIVALLFVGWHAFQHTELKNVPKGERPAVEAANKRHVRIAMLTTVVAVPVLAVAWVLISWSQQTQLVGSFTTSDEIPSYEYRAPFVVAEQLANRDLDNVIGDRVGAHAVQSADNPNQYTSLVIRRGWLEGYAAVQVIQPPLVGARNQTSNACHFDPSHKLRLDGFAPNNNLGYSLSFKRPFSFWDVSDSYGLCDGDEPVVVVPLKKLGGFWPVVTARPDGVAVYRGGELSVYGADEVPAELDGPTYPRSLAAQQRGASTASGSFADWIFKRAGFDTAGGRDSDDEDDEQQSTTDEPNAANAIDFSLIDDGGAGEYVTALTPVGASESVVALGHINNRQTGGDLNPYVVSRYEEALPALSTSENRIRSDFNHLPGWASGMRVMEITPAADGNFVASIGQNQVVTYRMLVATDGSVSVLDQAGGEAPAASDPAAPPSEGTDPATLSTEELQRLIKEYADELAERAEG
ncbi:hypothetical protein [Tessaracoccus massiliensis]|uniref:hypothetical protein n=1 Tax=Tessaracoccus massiliensis TaxID=1522311 RepID=UPI00058E2E0C|nr:hypothetical protein [Tessaracoccus massiliensis]